MDEMIFRQTWGYAFPVHWSVIVLVGGGIVVGAARLYQAERGGASRWMRGLLAGLRICGFVLLLFLLMDWHVVTRRYRRPGVWLCFDNSLSLDQVDKVPAERTREIEGRLKKLRLAAPTRFNLLRIGLDDSGPELVSRIQNRFNPRCLTIGDSVKTIELNPLDSLPERIKPTADVSRLDDGLSRQLGEAEGSPPAAVIFFTDGVDSDRPGFPKTRTLAQTLDVPVFPVLLGASEPADDSSIGELNANRKVFVNDIVEFQVLVAANGFDGRHSRLQLIDRDKDEIVAERELNISSDSWRENVRIRIRLSEERTHQFQIRLKPQDEEYNKENNQRSISIEVNGDPIRVLLAANYPSREFHYLKQFLGRGEKNHPDTPDEFARNRVVLETVLQQADTEYADVDRHAIKLFPVTRRQLEQYDVVILCDVKPNWAGTTVDGIGRTDIENLRYFVEEHGGGLVLIAGSRYLPQAYVNTAVTELFPIPLRDLVTRDETAQVSPLKIRRTPSGRNLLAMELGDGRQSKSYSDFEGAYWYASSPKRKPAAVVLAEFDDRGKSLPAIAMQRFGNGTVLYHAFDDTWRWRYRQGDLFFGRYWSQMIQYLASSRLARGGKKFLLETDRQEYYRGEKVVFMAQAVDRTRELERFLSVRVRSQTGFQRTLLLEKSGDTAGRYLAELDDLVAGSYSVWSEDQQQLLAEFQVRQSARETRYLPVNQTGLKRLAEATGGKLVPIGDLAELPDLLPEVEPVEVGSDPPWVLLKQRVWVIGLGLVILGIWTTEWWLRKTQSML